MLGSTCPIHSVTHFGVTHYAMHPALNTNTNCTCNFMPKRLELPRPRGGVGMEAKKRRLDGGGGEAMAKQLALDRIEAARVSSAALEDVSVDLHDAFSKSKGFTDTSRAPILAKLCTCTFVTKLDLEYNNIAVLPDAIGALTNLKELQLDGNEIVTLPASIGRLTALETLNLDNNILTAVPSSIGCLTSLTTLDLISNELTVLPDEIGKLTNLEHLWLSCNKLTALPDSIGKLTGLKTLSLDNNQLTTLPESIVKLTNLTEFELFRNPHFDRSAQSAAVQAWLQALEDSATCDVDIRC